MFELKTTKSSKVNMKGLIFENGIIMDIDGNVCDLNKIVSAAFEEGTVFDFTVQTKDDDTTVVEMEGEEVSE